jgi:hypothetical protein
MKKLELICNGDSWTFGCELVSDDVVAKFGRPGRYVGEYDYEEENDSHRIPLIWPTKLGDKLNANVMNLSFPADDNNTILQKTINYITTNYLTPKKSTENLLVIIGWSSPERNSFWYKDDIVSNRFRLWPNDNHTESSDQELFWKLYVARFWNAEEYLPRFILTVLQFQNFCEVNNIKYLSFNSFYQVPKSDIHEWCDLNIKDELLKNTMEGYMCTINGNRKNYLYNYINIWDTLSNKNFYKKDVKNNTFKSYIEKTCNVPFTGWHPSPEGHIKWADELYDYLILNKII